MSSARTHGVVADFDSAVGLGHVASEDGILRLFHCIEIADGTREIAVGVSVSFFAVQRFGYHEAADLRPIS